MDVSIIIVNYNTCSLLRDCINSIYEKTTEVSFEIIVVDNASIDDSCKMLAKKFPQVKKIISPQNLGFGRANNLGIEKAQGKYLFFLNSDTILLNNAIKYFFDYCELSKEKIGALGAILKDSSQKNIHSYGPFITIKGLLFDTFSKYLKPFGLHFQQNILYPDSIKDFKDVDYITGADLFIPYEVVKESGAFDPRFFMYCEEVDWQKRMQKAGYKRRIIQGPEIIHLEGGSAISDSRAWSYSRLKNIFISRNKYIYKYYGIILFYLFSSLNSLLWSPIIFISKRKLSDKIRLLRILLITK